MNVNSWSRTGALKLQGAAESPGGLIRERMVWPHPKLLDTVCQKEGLRSFIFLSSQGDAEKTNLVPEAHFLKLWSKVF